MWPRRCTASSFLLEEEKRGLGELGWQRQRIASSRVASSCELARGLDRDRSAKRRVAGDEEETLESGCGVELVGVLERRGFTTGEPHRLALLRRHMEGHLTGSVQRKNDAIALGRLVCELHNFPRSNSISLLQQSVSNALAVDPQGGVALGQNQLALRTGLKNHHSQHHGSERCRGHRQPSDSPPPHLHRRRALPPRDFS